jgi:hypothetical protein
MPLDPEHAAGDDDKGTSASCSPDRARAFQPRKDFLLQCLSALWNCLLLLQPHPRACLLTTR